MNQSTKEIASDAVREIEPELRELFTKVVERDPREAAKMLEPYPDEFVVQMLELLNPASALKILQRFPPSRRQTVLASASLESNQQWMRNQTYPERTIGRLMQPPLAVFRPQTTVAEAIELSAQPGEMVGVEREERLTTPWLRSLKFRHPWLQVNLFCGLLAALVVGSLQENDRPGHCAGSFSAGAHRPGS
jgi:Mg/Co/Ni transporter MgtE